MYGFYRVAAAVSKVRIANVKENVSEISGLYRRAEEAGCAAVVFPEMSLTGYTCGDLFFQKTLLDDARRGAEELAGISRSTVLIFGMPLKLRDAVYNVAAVAQNGKIRAVIPKTYLPNYREFYEKRQFTPADHAADRVVTIGGDTVPFGTKILLGDGAFSFCVEICEDLWSVIPPSSFPVLAGAKAVFNLSASNELAVKSEYRRELVKQQSARGVCAYVLTSCGTGESVSDVLFGGHAVIAENGRLAAENPCFRRESSLLFADVDVERLAALRSMESSFTGASAVECAEVALDAVPSSPDFSFASVPPYPFIPSDEPRRKERCAEIIAIQANALAERMDRIHAKTMVVGISGGLDSTLALLICCECARILKRPATDVLAITMPGFGTTGRTYRNAVNLCRELGVTLREINISAAALQHFKDIGHDPAVIDVAYENTQARERTQILMDCANDTGGIVIGTGDLSEIALGWCTYNGDHMSMYAVNSSVPKTLIRYLIANFAESLAGNIPAILRDIIDTPVSPELLPVKDDKPVQKTEEIIGPYELHDFFLYHFIKYGAPSPKIFALAKFAFHNVYPEELIRETLTKFLRRFFTQQFKRNCMPDGPKVGTVSLSPRGDWRMPSEADFSAWMNFE